MSRSPFLLLGTGLLVAATGCSGGGDDAPGAGGGGSAGDDRAFVPEGLSNTELAGQEGGLTLVAFTLEQGAAGLVLHAAVENEGATPACEVGMLIDYYDQTQQLVTSAGSAVLGGHFYLIDDGSGVVLTCIPPGKVGMTSMPALSPEVVLSDLGHLEHHFPAFTVPGVVPLDGVSVGKLTAVGTAIGSAYRGTLTNGLDQVLSSPKVTVFPVNRVGRPLAVATSLAPMEIPPGGIWPFETSSVGELGVGYAAFAGGSVVP
jgi:hypothetical protein